MRASTNKINKTSTAVEFSQEKGGIGLGLSVRNPLETRSYSAAFSTAFAKDSTTVATHPHE